MNLKMLLPCAVLGLVPATARAQQFELLAGFTAETKIKGGFLEHAGRLYFAAEKGGDYGLGYLGWFDPATGSLTPVYSFATDAKPKGGLVRWGGDWYLQGEKGSPTTGFGWIARFDPEAGTLTELYAFEGDVKPKSGLVAVGDGLWLATEKGGAGTGSLDRFNPQTWTVDLSVPLSFEFGTKIESFAADTAAGVLYAGAREGGDASQVGGKGAGTLLRVDPLTGAVTRLVAFHAEAHGAKLRGLTLHADRLWFVMEEGGNLALNSGKGGGTLVSYDLAGGTLTRHHVFDGAVTGFKPRALREVDGAFYVTTESGGTGGLGVFGVWREGRLEPLTEFSAELGAKPDFTLTAWNRRLLVVTELGGPGYLGSILAWSLGDAAPAERPTLQIVRQADRVRVQWPAGNGEFQLVVSATLEPASWQPIEVPVATEGPWHVVELPAGASRQFFLLRTVTH